MKSETPGTVKTRLDDAWESLKLGLVKGLSIGFRSLEESYDKGTGGYRFLRWAWHELSCVTIPANADCTIQTIRAASGAEPTRYPRRRSGFQACASQAAWRFNR
jgi:phage head maturation protease